MLRASAQGVDRARALSSVVALLVGICGAGRAYAAPPASDAGLNWVRLPGAESCISAARLVEHLEQRDDRVLFTSTAQADLFIDGRVEPVDLNGWLVTIEMSDREGRVFGTRSLLFRGVDCSVIEDSVTLFIATRLYPGTGFDDPLPIMLEGDWPIRDNPNPSPAEFPSWTATGARDPEARREPSAQRRAAFSALASPSRAEAAILDLAAVAGVGQLPGVGPGASAHVTIATGLGWPLQVGFTALFERAQQAEAVSGQAAFSLQLGSAQLCPLTPARWFSLCAGAELGRLGVTPSGFRDLAWEGSRVVVGALASTVLRLPLPGPLSLQVRLTLAVPLARPAYQYEIPSGKQELFRMSQFAGRGELGMGFEL